MPDINTIRNLRNCHDKSINAIRKELNINWRTAKKYADEDYLPSVKKIEKRGMMYDEKWGEIVGGWINEDALLPRKKRRTNLAYHKELRGLGFTGSYRTVCDFVSLYKQGLVEVTEDAGYERLEHPPAEAQLDFGTMEVEHEGSFKDVKVLIMTFAYSNAGFFACLPSENTECLLSGLINLFDQLGGVPQKIRIDNMTTAVVVPKTKFEEAKLTDTFLQFAHHYRFEVQICNPRSGHEKGNVENKVGYTRNHFFSATPRMVSYEQLNDELQEDAWDDMNRPHYEKMVSIQKLFNEEKKYLYPLPETKYPAFKEVELKANKYNEVMIDKTRIHVPRARNYGFIKAVLRWDSYQVMTSSGVVIDEGPRPYMNKSREIPWQSIFHDWRRKLNVIPYSRYFKYLPVVLKTYLGVEADLRQRYERVKQLVKFLETYSMSEIEAKFYELIGADEESESYDVDWHNYDQLALPECEVSG